MTRTFQKMLPVLEREERKKERKCKRAACYAADQPELRKRKTVNAETSLTLYFENAAFIQICHPILGWY